MHKLMKRWPIILLVLAVFLSLAVVAGYRIGTRLLEGKIVEALGPGSHLDQIKVNWFSIELSGLRIDAPKGWPAARTLEAERVILVPDLRSLLTERIHISSIVVEKPYLSMLRTPGKLALLPSLTERKNNPSSPSENRTVTIARVELKNGSLDLFDATVRRPPLKIRMEQIDAVVRDIAVPAAEKTGFELAGIVKGIRRDGRAKINGWTGPAARNSWSRISLTAVDMVALQPYLVKQNEGRVSSGSLDLNLDTEVRNNYLNGKGKIVLQNLEFAASRGVFDTFMGLPRSTVIAFLKDNNNVIDLDFTLTGDAKQPNFSLNESLSTRIAASMAGQLGVSIIGVAEGLGTLGRKGMEGAGSVVDGVGAAIKGLFGSQ